MKVVHWKSRTTGAAGHGSPMQAKLAEAWVAYLKDKLPELIHWTEEADA